MSHGARRIGLFTAGCVLVSNAVGSGIFTTSGFLARDLGDPLWVLGLWAAGALLALAGALSYAELGAALPRVGGEYVYLRRAFGPLAGFLSGWTSFTLGFGAAIAAAAAAFGAYTVRLAPDALAGVDPRALALLLVWTLSAIHALGVERGGQLQRWITVTKIGGTVLLAALAIGSGAGDWSHVSRPASDVAPSLGSAAVGLVFVLYSFSGWNAAAYIAGEIHAPARNLPLATIAGTAFVGLLYLVLNLVYFYALPVEVLAAEPVLPIAEKVATALHGPGAAAVVVAVLCVSIAGATSSMIWAGPRVTWAMAEDGMAPAMLGRATAGGAPRPALLLQTGWVSLLIASGSFEQLVVYAGVALALFGALATLAVVVLRLREPELSRPFRVRPYPFVPIAYTAASLGLGAYAGLERPLEAGFSLLTVAAGLPLYAWLRRRARRRSELPAAA